MQSSVTNFNYMRVRYKYIRATCYICTYFFVHIRKSFIFVPYRAPYFIRAPFGCVNSFNTTLFRLKFPLRFLILCALAFVIMQSLFFAVYSLRYLFGTCSVNCWHTYQHNFQRYKICFMYVFNATKATLISYFFVVSIFQRTKAIVFPFLCAGYFLPVAIK